jgi:1-acyl-sn-glycerol-3-phosphate acyltransferase
MGVMDVVTHPEPTAAELAAAEALLAPWRAITDPRIDGYDQLPADGRYLLVGNHSTLGLFDVPFVVLGIRRHTGILVRSLGERQHYRVPVWRDLLTRFGTVNGRRENARALMEAGLPVLVFPGGGREVARRRDERYRLVWKERIGFARLALEFGYPVVPLSMVGVDDMWDVVLDADDALYGPARALATRLDIDPDLLWPVVRGLGPTPLPRPQRIYARIGCPIDARAYGSRWADSAGARALRGATQAAIETGIADLLRERETDPARHLVPRLMGEARRAAHEVPLPAIVRPRSAATALRHLLAQEDDPAVG